MARRESFEYGYLHALWLEGPNRWVSVTETHPEGLTVVGDGEPLLAVLNRLGSEGWRLSESVSRRDLGEQEPVPPVWNDTLAARFATGWTIRHRQTRVMERRVVWDDGT